LFSLCFLLRLKPTAIIALVATCGKTLAPLHSNIDNAVTIFKDQPAFAIANVSTPWRRENYIPLMQKKNKIIAIFFLSK
jgi:hypothetical protein